MRREIPCSPGRPSGADIPAGDPIRDGWAVDAGDDDRGDAGDRGPVSHLPRDSAAWRTILPGRAFAQRGRVGGPADQRGERRGEALALLARLDLRELDDPGTIRALAGAIWFHRISHESRVFWASHIVHHSSQHYNLSTALRQTWVPLTYLPFWLPLPLLGFPPWMVLLAQSWSLIYQFGLHTERIATLPRRIEQIFNTPSHHRVHHGANEPYLDRNYGGILVI